MHHISCIELLYQQTLNNQVEALVLWLSAVTRTPCKRAPCYPIWFPLIVLQMFFLVRQMKLENCLPFSYRQI